MKRFLMALGLIVFFGVLAYAAATVDYKGITVPSEDPTGTGGSLIINNFKELADRTHPYFIVAASNAPSVWKKIAGATCDGAGDQVEVQAAIDVAETLDLRYGPKVFLSPGNYSFSAPIYIGYAGGVPKQNKGVSLVGVRHVRIDTTFSDRGQFAIYCQPKSGAIVEIEGLDINLGSSIAGGLYVSNLNSQSSVSKIGITGGSVACLYLDNCWSSRLQDISVDYGRGIGIGTSGFHAARADTIGIIDMTGSNLTTGGVVRYVIDNLDGTFYTGEEVNITDVEGDERGVVLDASSTALIIGHSNRARFVGDETIYGVTSGASADVNVTIQDLGAALLINGAQSYWTNLNIETSQYTDDDAGYDHPLVLGYTSITGNMATGGMTIDNIRFQIKSTEFGQKMADVWFHFRRVDGLRLTNVYAPNGAGPLSDSSVAVAGQGDGTSDITGIATGLTGSAEALYLDVGDTIYLYDTANDTNDGLYTVSAVGEGTATINDGDFTDADIHLFATTLATRQQPEYCVVLEDCNGAVISNIRAYTFDSAFVQVDADCKNCIIDNVWNYAYSRTLGITEDFWLWHGRHEVILDDSGTNTKLTNALIHNYTSLEYVAKTGVEVITETVDGSRCKTTLLLKDVEMTVTDAGVGDEGYGNVEIFEFSEGRILVLGVIANLTVNVSDRFDVGGSISDTGSGDFSLGTTGTADETLDGTEVNLAPSTAMNDPFVNGIGATLHTELIASAQLDGTGGALDCYLNAIFDAGDVTANSTAGFNGTITIHWVNLGDY